MNYDVYLKKLTTQELGYRKGRLMTGGYFYISKSAVGTFFEELDKYIHNDSRTLVFNDPLEPEKLITASYVYHNDQYALENGTRNEYRIYHNRSIASHDLHFQPYEIIAFIKESDDKYRLEHFTRLNTEYKLLEETIENSKIRGNHALLTYKEYEQIFTF